MSRPNILWICTDQQRFDTIGAVNSPHVDTPNLDELCARGVAFDHAYCQSPVCTPSRASFLTGHYPSSTHWTRNGNVSAPPGHPPLVTKLLADHGYRCGLIGKLHLASAAGGVENRTDDGYTYWQYSHGPQDSWTPGHDYADWVHERGGIHRDLVADPNGVPEEWHQTTWCAEKAIEFLQAGATSPEPWLASVNIYDPHPPFNPPRSYRERFDPSALPPPLFRESDLIQQQELSAIDFQGVARRPDDLDLKNRFGPPEGRTDAQTLKAAYFAMIALVDAQVGRILRALDDSGQRDNTVVIFMSDHGEMLGDHGLIQKGCRFYEGLVRVPLIISQPGTIREGVVCSDLVELTDIAPTILELAGIPAGDAMQGRSLLPLLTTDRGSGPHRQFVRCEYFDALAGSDGTFATMFRTRRHKLVVYHGHGKGELYDLDEDPAEFTNLWDSPDHQALVRDMLAQSFDASMLNGVDVGTARVAPF